MGDGDDDLAPFVPAPAHAPALVGPRGIPFGPQPRLPRRGQGALGTRFDREAATRYELDDVMRGTIPRHRVDEARRRGEQLAYEAKSWDHLYQLVRRETASHSIDVGGPLAKALADSALTAYRKRVSDDGWAALAVGVGLEQSFAEDKRAAVATLAKGLERQAAAAKEAQYREFLMELEAMESEPQRAALRRLVAIEPAQIQSSLFKMGGVVEPFYELYREIAPYVSLALDFVPVVGQVKGVLEAIGGKDIFTGRKLAGWERGLGGGLALLPFARGAFGTVRAGIGTAGRAGRHGMRGVAALAVQARKQVPGLRPEEIYRAMKGLSRVDPRALQTVARIPVSAITKDATTAAQDRALKVVASAFDDTLEAGSAAGSRTASGTLGGAGRNPLSATASGTIIAKGAAPAAAGALRALSRAAQNLVAKGFDADGLRTLERLGVRFTDDLVKRLVDLGDTAKGYVNVFHRSKGFHHVVKDLATGGMKAEGAKFVMKYATTHPDVVTNALIDPTRIVFESGIGKIFTKKFGDIFAREVDIVVRGRDHLGVGFTIHTELKNWTAKSLSLSARTGKNKNTSKLGRQLAKDIGIFEPTALGRTVTGDTLRWVFNAAKTPDKTKIIDAFVQVIRQDPYLSVRWGDDVARIRSVLDKIIEVH